MRKTFPLFQSHLDLSKTFWQKILDKPSLVIDATLGNGWDAKFLAGILADYPGSKLIGLDIQKEAIEAAKELLAPLPEWVAFKLQSHASFPKEVQENSVALIVYNLGYLPGGDKSLTTNTETTLESLESALPLIEPGGVISLTLYPGHPEGEREAKALLTFAKTLSPKDWCVTYLSFSNRNASPALLLIQKGIDG